jgi:GNAT superfamily N-acetyltransferase
MPSDETSDPGLIIRPLTPARWADFVRLFGPRGACAGCWCMWWRRTQAEFIRGKGAAHRRAQRARVHGGTVPGLLAYRAGVPVGWCAVEPRSAYRRLARARTLRPVDDQPVWSVTCFFVAKEARGRGVTVALLRAAVAHARRHGGKIVEGYPVDPGEGRLPAVFAYTGLVAAYRAAGFKEIARPARTRPIMRIAT